MNHPGSIHDSRHTRLQETSESKSYGAKPPAIPKHENLQFYRNRQEDFDYPTHSYTTSVQSEHGHNKGERFSSSYYSSRCSAPRNTADCPEFGRPDSSYSASSYYATNKTLENPERSGQLLENNSRSYRPTDHRHPGEGEKSSCNYNSFHDQHQNQNPEGRQSHGGSDTRICRIDQDHGVASGIHGDYTDTQYYRYDYCGQLVPRMQSESYALPSPMPHISTLPYTFQGGYHPLNQRYHEAQFVVPQAHYQSEVKEISRPQTYPSDCLPHAAKEESEFDRRDEQPVSYSWDRVGTADISGVGRNAAPCGYFDSDVAGSSAVSSAVHAASTFAAPVTPAPAASPVMEPISGNAKCEHGSRISRCVRCASPSMLCKHKYIQARCKICRESESLYCKAHKNLKTTCKLCWVVGAPDYNTGNSRSNRKARKRIAAKTAASQAIGASDQPEPRAGASATASLLPPLDNFSVFMQHVLHEPAEGSVEICASSADIAAAVIKQEQQGVGGGGGGGSGLAATAAVAKETIWGPARLLQGADRKRYLQLWRKKLRARAQFLSIRRSTAVARQAKVEAQAEYQQADKELKRILSTMPRSALQSASDEYRRGSHDGGGSSRASRSGADDGGATRGQHTHLQAYDGARHGQHPHLQAYDSAKPAELPMPLGVFDGARLGQHTHLQIVDRGGGGAGGGGYCVVSV